MFKSIFAVIVSLVVVGPDMAINGRSLRRVWFAAMVFLGILLACIGGVDAAPVQGEGVAPANTANPAQARMLALRAAKVEAMRNGQAAGYRQIVAILKQDFDGHKAIVILDMQ